MGFRGPVRCAVLVGIGALLAASIAPAAEAAEADPIVTVACVTDTADVVSVEVPVSQAPAAIEELPRENPCDVAAIDTPVQALGVSNDPQRSYAFNNVPFENAWSVANGAGVTVAVIDTGVQANHPDLNGQLLAGATILSGVTTLGSAVDGNGHGTHVTGIVAALSNNALGSTGAAPGVKVLPVKVLADNGQGNSSDVAAGINWAVLQGADVINMSLGAAGENALITTAVANAISNNVTVVAAAGNSNTNTAFYPAANAGVIGVSSVDSNNVKSSFSNYGTYIDLAAPGSAISSTWIGSAYALDSGTSMASPFVAAAAALVLQANPTYTPAQVTSALASSAVDLGDPGRDDLYGYGLINPAKALCGALCGAPAVTQITPSRGATSAGTTVTFTGTNLQGATAVTFGGTSGTALSLISPTSLTVQAPAHVAGSVDVSVTTLLGSVGLAGGYTYADAPGVTSLSTTTGPIGGGTAVTITGTSFTGATGVTFGGTSGTSLRNVTDTSLTITAPAHAAGDVTVQVTAPGGIGQLAAAFTYVDPPSVTSATPATGPAAGGTSVVITGSHLTGATGVTFGGAAATDLFVNSDSSITVTTPAHDAGAVAIQVTTAYGTGSSAGAFTYEAPAAAGGAPAASPGSSGGSSGGSSAPSAGGGGGGATAQILEVRQAFGPVTGGTRIAILGFGFWGATGVTIGGRPATDFRYIDAATLEVTTPPGELGWQPLVVTLPVGDTKAAFNYQAAASTGEVMATTTAPTTPTSAALLAPAAIRAASSKSVVLLKWRNRSTAPVARQFVTVLAGGKVVRRITVAVGATSVSVRSLKVGATYRFTVTVVASNGTSSTSPSSRPVKVAS